MSDIAKIQQLARQILLAGDESRCDQWLWDRTKRIVRNCDLICKMPEISDAKLAIDRFCLLAAAWLSESGFSLYDGIDESSWTVVLSEINPADLRKFSLEKVDEVLIGEISDTKVEKISRIITESGTLGTVLTEGRILSDARGLEDMGAIGIFNDFRKYTIHGQSIPDVLAGWTRKLDYRYWESRINESFHFDSVRQVAKRRLNTAESFMKQLSIENLGRDLDAEFIEEL